MYTLLMIGMVLIVGLGVPLFVWISYRILRPTREEENIHQRIEEARRRIDKFPF